MKFELRNGLTDCTSTVVISVLNDDKRERLIEKVGEVYGFDSGPVNDDFKSELGEIQILYPGKEKVYRLVLVGLGENPGYGEVRLAFRAAGAKLKEQSLKEIGLDFITTGFESFIGPAVAGWRLGFHNHWAHKEKDYENETVPDLVVYVPDEWDCSANVRNAIDLAETQARIMNLVDASANRLTPTKLAEWTMRSGDEYGYDVKAWDRDKIKEHGLDALLAVSKGSEESPAFIICEYRGNPKTEKTSIGLVGKGITFDTGGISIKPSSNMEYMKSDMGGGAAVLGTIEIAARLKLPLNIVCVVPAAQNDVGSRAVKPGDVVGSYLGKTIEVINTDAEGRMVLADGLAYLNATYKPDVLIDLATLTGSCVRAIGYEAGGLFTTNENLADNLRDAGEEAGERLWPFPMWDSYSKDLKSDVADLRNIGTKPVADAIMAAKFLEEFVDQHPSWAHLDIAGVAFGDSRFSGQKSGTAFGVGLLLQFLLKTINQDI